MGGRISSLSFYRFLSGAAAEQRLPTAPHSLRATTAKLLLDVRERIESVENLLDHKYIITTNKIYDKQRRSVRDSALHKGPI